MNWKLLLFSDFENNLMDIGKLNGYWEAHEEKEKSLFLFFFFWLCFDVCELSSSTRMESVAPAVGVESLNHWTTREVLPPPPHPSILVLQI